MSGTEHDAIDQEKPAIDADNARPDTADRDIDRTRSVLAEWLATKLGPGASPEITEIAAYTTVASTLINLDETITKE